MAIDWVSVERILRRRFRQRAITVGTGSFTTTLSGRPLLGHELLAAASNDLEERHEISSYDVWPGCSTEVLESRWRARRWFHFYWDSFGPMSWLSGLYLLRLGNRRSLVCLMHEQQPLYLLGIANPDNDPLLLSRVFRELVADNGRRLGVQLFGSIPTETTNWLPRLVPEAVVKQSYWHWLEWAEASEGSAWLCFEQELIRKELEPNPLRRSLTTLTDLPHLHDADSVGDWLKQRDKESAALPDHSRQLLLNDYFHRYYEEPTTPP